MLSRLASLCIKTIKWSERSGATFASNERFLVWAAAWGLYKTNAWVSVLK
jgi:hypothetical protein